MLKLIPIPSLTLRQFCLVGSAACLVGIHLTLVSRTTHLNLFASSILFWVAIAALIGSKRHSLKINSDRVSTGVGAILVAIVLFRSSVIAGYDPFLRLSPLLSGVGMALLASGVKEVKQYWRELLILCFLAPSPGALAFLIDISTQTAQFSTYILWHLGFLVSRQETYIHLPHGSIEVYPGCSGIESMLHLLGLATLFLLMFPSTRTQKVVVPLVAVAIGFIINGFRVALMAFLASYSTRENLDYWHIGQGSFVFSMISVSILGLFCFYVLQVNLDEDDDSLEQ